MAKNLKRKEPTEPASKKLKVTSSSGKQFNLSSFLMEFHLFTPKSEALPNQALINVVFVCFATGKIYYA